MRDRLNVFVERHEVAWELTMGAFALACVALGFLIDEVGSGTRSDLELVERRDGSLTEEEFAAAKARAIS
jgi:hypothetical protein